MRLIDADTLREEFRRDIMGGLNWDRILREAKPVDAVPVRCKDCKYNPNPPECGNAACVLFYGMTDQMGFCHHGERRERE